MINFHNLFIIPNSKYMLASSQDLLFIVSAFCILWVSIFLCWALYYLIAILRDVKWTVEETREKVEMIGKLVDTIEEKVHSSGTYFAMGMRALMQFFDHIRERKGDLDAAVSEAVEEAIKKPEKKIDAKQGAKKKEKK